MNGANPVPNTNVQLIGAAHSQDVGFSKRKSKEIEKNASGNYSLHHDSSHNPSSNSGTPLIMHQEGDEDEFEYEKVQIKLNRKTLLTSN